MPTDEVIKMLQYYSDLSDCDTKRLVFKNAIRKLKNFEKLEERIKELQSELDRWENMTAAEIGEMAAGM